MALASKLIQTPGIILGRTNYGEADRILRILTPDEGKISAIAKGARRIKSKAGGHLEPLGETELSLSHGRGSLHLVTSARLRWYPHNLTSDPDRLSFALMIASAVDRLTEPDHPTAGLYELTKEALVLANDGQATVLTEAWFKLRLATALGYHPDLSGCIVCGKSDGQTNYFFAPTRGGIVCESDRGAGDTPISTSIIKLWRLLCSAPYGTIAGVTGGIQLAGEGVALIDAFYAHHLGRTFKPSLIGDSL